MCNWHFLTLSSGQQTVLWTFAARSLRQQVREGPTEWDGAIGAFGRCSIFQDIPTQDFRFGTWYEDIGGDAEAAAVEVGNACDVLKGFTGGHPVEGRQSGRGGLFRDLIFWLYDMSMTLCPQLMFQKGKDHFPRLPLIIHPGNPLISPPYQMRQQHV